MSRDGLKRVGVIHMEYRQRGGSFRFESPPKGARDGKPWIYWSQGLSVEDDTRKVERLEQLNMAAKPGGGHPELRTCANSATDFPLRLQEVLTPVHRVKRGFCFPELNHWTAIQKVKVRQKTQTNSLLCGSELTVRPVVSPARRLTGATRHRGDRLPAGPEIQHGRYLTPSANSSSAGCVSTIVVRGDACRANRWARKRFFDVR